MRKMKLVVLAGLAGIVVFSTPAQGQVPQVNRSMEVQLCEPAIGPHSFMTVHGGDVLPHLAFNAGLYLGYQHNPLQGHTVWGEEMEHRVSVIGSQLYGNVMLAMGLFKYFQLGLGLPVALYQTGDGVNDMGEPAGGLTSAAGVGDLRIHLAGRLVKWKGLRVGIALPVTVPSGDDKAYLGERSLTLRPVLAIELRWRGLSVAANFGYLWRLKDTEFFSSEVGDQILYSGAVAYNFSRIRLSVLAEITGRHGLSLDFDEAPLEILGAVRFALKQQIAITAGFGAGLIQGIGSPVFRAFAGIVWTYGITRKARSQVAKMSAVTEVKPKEDAEAELPEPTKTELDTEQPPDKAIRRTRPRAAPPAPPARRVVPRAPPTRRVVPRAPARPALSAKKLASRLALVGLRPEDLAIFKKLNESYKGLLQVLEQRKDHKGALAAFQKTLAAKKCKDYLRAKRRWIRKKLRKRRQRGLSTKARRRWRARYRAARKKAKGGTCAKRSLALCPVLRGILDALGSR